VQENETMQLRENGQAPTESLNCQFINLNKQCMITRDWEAIYLMMGETLFRHLYKEYIIFLRTRDDSLVQISGSNIFSYLNEKLGGKL
jgi:hypothetical protein